MKKMLIAGMIATSLLTLLSACGTAPAQPPSNTAQSGLETGVNSPSQAPTAEGIALDTVYEIHNGTHDRTLAAPADLPAAYDYGSGRYTDFMRDGMQKKLPEPVGNQTVLNTPPQLGSIQVLYLWEEDNAPAQTKFTEDMTGYFDTYDFRPYLTAIPVQDGTKAKGAVVLMAGGAYQFRGNYTDTLPAAIHLRELGFHTFIVDYRLSPYTPQEGSLDVARAVRFIRKNADIYGIEPDNIAVMGYSAEGIQAGEFLMHYDDLVNGTALDHDYVPNEGVNT